MEAFVGNSEGEFTAPLIKIVPGFMPPIVDPVGNVIVFFSAEILASPIYNVKGDI